MALRLCTHTHTHKHIATLINVDTTQNLSLNINNEMHKISKWMKSIKLSLSEIKTKFMIFHNPQET